MVHTPRSVDIPMQRATSLYQEARVLASVDCWSKRRENICPQSRYLTLWITWRQTAEKREKAGTTDNSSFFNQKASMVSRFVPDNRQPDIETSPPDDLRQDKNPQRDVAHQKRNQAYSYDANQSTAIFSTYRFTAINGDADKPENICEAR